MVTAALVAMVNRFKNVINRLRSVEPGLILVAPPKPKIQVAALTCIVTVGVVNEAVNFGYFHHGAVGPSIRTGLQNLAFGRPVRTKALLGKDYTAASAFIKIFLTIKEGAEHAQILKGNTGIIYNKLSY